MKTALLGFLLLVSSAHAQQLATTSTPLQLDAHHLAPQSRHIGTDERIANYEKLVAASPSNLQSLTGLIQAYLQKLRETADGAYLTRAALLVDKLLELDGSSPTAVAFQNAIDMQRHDFKTVVERARSRLKYSPSDASAWGNLGDALMELGDYPEAGKAFARMFALGPNLGSYNRAAWFRFVTGDAAGGIALMQQAVDSGSDSPENTAWCWAELGDMLFRTGQLAQANAAYQNALGLFPTLHRARAGQGKIEAAEGRLPQAIKSYEQAQSIVPMVEYADALESLYTAAGLPAKAQQQAGLIQAIEKLGVASHELTNRNLALALANHNRDLPRALQLAEAEVPVRGDVYSYDALAWVLFQSGRIAEAQAASEKATRVGTPEPRFYFHASQIFQAAGDSASAQRYRETLTALNPQYAGSAMASAY